MSPDASVPHFCSFHCLLLSGICGSGFFFVCFFLLLFAFVSFHFSFLVRQPYSETSCSCVLVDGSIVWTRRTIKAKKKKKKKEKWKGQPEAVNWTLFSFLKCEETLKTASQDLWDERVNIDIEYVVILLFPLASFLCFFFFPLVTRVWFPPFFFCQLYILLRRLESLRTDH